MEPWMAVHGVLTREEWEARQPKPDPYDNWCCALQDDDGLEQDEPAE